MKILGYFEKVRYVYKIEKKRLSKASFWLVKDVDFMNVVRIAEMWCVSMVEVLELSLDEKAGHDISVVIVDTGKAFEEMEEEGKVNFHK